MDLDTKLKKLLNEKRFKTQSQISGALSQQGINVPQPTLSRALNRLNAVKTEAPNGSSFYQIQAIRPEMIYQNLVTSIIENGQIVIIQTRSGAANHIGEIIDSAEIKHIAGSIAGDNTIFIAPTDIKHLKTLSERLNTLLGF